MLSMPAALLFFSQVTAFVTSVIVGKLRSLSRTSQSWRFRRNLLVGVACLTILGSAPTILSVFNLVYISDGIPFLVVHGHGLWLGFLSHFLCELEHPSLGIHFGCILMLIRAVVIPYLLVIPSTSPYLSIYLSVFFCITSCASGVNFATLLLSRRASVSLLIHSFLVVFLLPMVVDAAWRIVSLMFCHSTSTDMLAQSAERRLVTSCW